MTIATRGNWHRRPRLRFWLWLMAGCEKRGLENSALYHWCVRRAMGCNAWRKNWWRA